MSRVKRSQIVGRCCRSSSTLVTQRGNRKLLCDGYFYVFDKASSNGTVKFWRCERRRNCKARIHVSDDKIVKLVNAHSHEGLPASKVKDEDVSSTTRREDKIKIRLEEDYTSKDTHLQTLVHFPAPKEFESFSVEKTKRVALFAPTLATLQIPEEYKQIRANVTVRENFLLADSGPGEARILLFGRRRNLAFLRDSLVWYVDPTVKTRSPLFSHACAIFGEKFGELLPPVFALLPNKRLDAYDTLFQMLCGIDRELAPRAIFCNFEALAWKSLKKHFPDTQIRGDLFHLVQSFQKYLVFLELVRDYGNDFRLALQIRMTVALAFVPVSHLEDALERLSKYLAEELLPLLEWFEDNFLGRMESRGGSRRRPAFPAETWNLYDRVVNGENWTNNNRLVAMHRRLQTELERQRDDGVWEIIEGLRQVQCESDRRYDNFIGVPNAFLKVENFRDDNACIFSIVQSYENLDLIEYLKRIAINIEVDL